MSLFRRNKGAREAGNEAAPAEPGLTGAEAPAAESTPGADAAPAATAASGGREPAELDALVGEAPSSRRRGKLRRRLRHLRRVREVLLRDLGGLTFELHRTGSGEGGPALDGKLARLSAVGREIRSLEDQLSDHRAMIVREPGIGGTCAECGELFGSEARFCWACGNPVAAGTRGVPHLAAWTTQPQLTSGAPATATPLQPASVDSTWVDHPASEDPTAPLPQMDPQAVTAETPAANEPVTGDVGGEAGVMWSDHAPAPAEPEPAAAAEAEPATAPAEPEPDPPAAAPTEASPAEHPLPAEGEREPLPPLSSGDPLASPQRPAQS
jgi:hypothetical protein